MNSAGGSLSHRSGMNSFGLMKLVDEMLAAYIYLGNQVSHQIRIIYSNSKGGKGTYINRHHHIPWNPQPSNPPPLLRCHSSQISRHWREQSQRLIDDRKQIIQLLHALHINLVPLLKSASNLLDELLIHRGISEEVIS
jgi:hypothetical protein